MFLTTMSIALWLTTLACGAESEMMTATPETMTTMTKPDPNQATAVVDVPKDALEAAHGTVTTIGDCRCGIVSAGSDDTVISTTGPGWPEATQRLRKGELLNACGAFHRVVGFGARGSNQLPGGSGNYVLIDRRPTTTVSLSPGTVTLSLGGDLGPFGPGNVILKGLSITGPSNALRARFTVRHQGGEQTIEAGAGEVLTLGPTRHKMVEVKAPDAATGVPGWIEIEKSATP